MIQVTPCLKVPARTSRRQINNNAHLDLLLQTRRNGLRICKSCNEENVCMRSLVCMRKNEENSKNVCSECSENMQEN